MSDSAPQVSVLVPVRNEERWIRETVEAMQAQDVDGPFELLFADGASSDCTREILLELAAKDPRIRVFDNPRQTTPSGLNVCLREARGEYVARMDAHTFYPPGYLRLGIERLQAGDTSWVSGLAVPRPVGGISRVVALAYGSKLGQGSSRKWTARSDTAEVELDTGVFGGVWRRTKVLQYGGWDERWAQNQDGELAARFIENGERLVCLSAMAAEYVPRDTLARLWRQYVNYGFHRAATGVRHPRSLRRSNLLPPALVVTGAAAVVAPRPVRRLARIGIAGYAAALLVEAGRASSRAESAREAAMFPVVVAVMHTAHGVGMLKAFRQLGLPLAAISYAVGLEAAGDRLAPAAEPVQAPSLFDA